MKLFFQDNLHHPVKPDYIAAQARLKIDMGDFAQWNPTRVHNNQLGPSFQSIKDKSCYLRMVLGRIRSGNQDDLGSGKLGYGIGHGP